MALVVDCSVTVGWFFASEITEFGTSILDRLETEPMIVPALWTLEFASAIRNAERRGRIDAKARRAILEQASRLPFEIDDRVIPVAEIGELAARLDLTPYDAVYLELARRRRVPLATLDARLVQAARGADLPIVTDPALFPERRSPASRPRRRSKS